MFTTLTSRWRRARIATLIGPAVLMSAGCSTLPTSGPTGREILRASAANDVRLPFKVIEVETASSLPAAAPGAISTLPGFVRQATDIVGPGDILDITIYEAGVSLFGGSLARSAVTVSAPSANAERLSQVRVDDDGYVRLPFIGRLRAAGRTTSDLQSMIRQGLRGMSQDPQVMVSLAQSVTNSVLLAGEVAKPGRVVLVTNRESLTDTLALAGGYRGEAKDLVVRVQRDQGSYEARLSDVFASSSQDLAIAPGDRITLMSRPQSFSVLGASNRAEQIRFPRGAINLAEAVALAGGANPNLGDASAIFVFRYSPRPDGKEEPVVYHVNMMRPGAYFLAQRFQMRDEDVLYVGNAQANQPGKLVQLLSQLFVPIQTVRSTIIQ